MRRYVMIIRGRYPCRYGIRYGRTALALTPCSYARLAWGTRLGSHYAEQ